MVRRLVAMNEEIKEPTLNADIPKEPMKEPEKSPAQKLEDSLKEYPFIKYDGTRFVVAHKELTCTLTPKILKIRDLSKRGIILGNLSGGVVNLDAQTLALNSFLATISVGFDDLPKNFDLLNVEDSELVMALYIC